MICEGGGGNWNVWVSLKHSSLPHSKLTALIDSADMTPHFLKIFPILTLKFQNVNQARGQWVSHVHNLLISHIVMDYT